jgi:hypothetical protein
MVVDVDMVPNAGDNLIKIVSHSSLTLYAYNVECLYLTSLQSS